ncbi:MAG: AraC family transcriptional regulator [bacterium]|nr:AraC family transcriptional regulator [bacterium]
MPERTIGSLCERLGFADGHGYRDTPLPSVKIFRAADHEAACPLLYENGLGFVLQGYKLGVAADMKIRTGGDRYLILSNHATMRCETLATSEEPVLGVHVAIDHRELQRLVHLLREESGDGGKEADIPLVERSIVSARMTGDVRSAVGALVDLLHDPVACEALGSGALSRLYFAVLRSEDGRVLASLARTDSKLARISATMSYMEQHLDERIGVDQLASIARMSRSAFQRTFKDVSGESPLQYLKQLRLSTARNLITFKGEPAYVAAHRVGYESASQFSREFKRYYGLPPSRAAELPYSRMQGVA